MGSDRSDLNSESGSTCLILEHDSAVRRFRLTPSCSSRGQGMIGRLNHVGVATPSIAVYRTFLGATAFTEPRALPEQGVSFCFVDLPNAQIELIEPYGADSPIR